MDIERLKAGLRRPIEKLDLFVQLLPRPIQKLDDEILAERLFKTTTSLVAGVITVKTGKMLRLGLKSRELNKFGRGSAIFGVVLSSGLVLLYAHESWVRLRNRQIEASFDSFSDEDKELLESLRVFFDRGPSPISFTLDKSGS